jgi:endonuclease/exonuclease/phosphatase family metal-dependent hydrolase
MRGRYVLPALLMVGLAAVVFVFNASRAGTKVEGCAQGCATALQSPGTTLRVMSMNVLHDLPRFKHLSRRLDLVADAIRQEGVDIALLQEVPWNRRVGNGADYVAGRLGYNYLYVRANGNRHTIFFEEGEAILSRFPLREVSFVELAPRAGFFEHRVALHATAITPWGDVDLFATHLTTGGAGVNQAQASSLQAFVKGSGNAPALVGGDFNAREGSPQIEMLVQEWVDTYRTANPDDAGPTCCVDDLAAGPGETLEKRIDYLFLVPRGGQRLEVKGAWRVLDTPVRTADGWQWASDHVGVVAELDPR